jgi:hypothetical protein
MLKNVNGSSTLGKLLKNTKISQLQKSIGDRVLNSNDGFPTHQIIEAPSSSFSRRDFGLKMRIPKKIKTRRIIVNDLDNKYGLPNFEILNGDYFKKQRFQELGIPVNANFSNTNTFKNGYANKDAVKPSYNPLFSSSKEFSAPQTISGLLHIKNQPLNSENFLKNIKPELKSLRRPFLKWLAQNYPESLSKASLNEEFQKFLEVEKPQLISNDKNFIPSTYADNLSGTAGLSYNLKGRLFQTPNGPQSSRIVPGRIVGTSGNTKCAVGGFVANVSNNLSRGSYVEKLILQNRTVDGENFARQLKVPTSVTEATLYLDNKQLTLNAEPVNKHTSSNSRYISKKDKRDSSASTSYGFDELMNILKSAKPNQN